MNEARMTWMKHELGKARITQPRSSVAVSFLGHQHCLYRLTDQVRLIERDPVAALLGDDMPPPRRERGECGLLAHAMLARVCLCDRHERQVAVAAGCSLECFGRARADRLDLA